MPDRSFHSFVIGSQYHNGHGAYAVLAIDYPAMQVCYDNGVVATLDIPIQQRIHSRLMQQREPRRSLSSTSTAPIARPQRSPSGFWWVNQGVSYAKECAGGLLWAGKADAAGHTMSHHETMRDLHLGDRLLHYADREIKAIGTVGHGAIEVERRPYTVPGDRELHSGYLVQVAYAPLAAPIPLRTIPGTWRVAERGPFNKHGTPNLGYLYPLSHKFARQLMEHFPDELGQLLEA